GGFGARQADLLVNRLAQICPRDCLSGHRPAPITPALFLNFNDMSLIILRQQEVRRSTPVLTSRPIHPFSAVKSPPAPSGLDSLEVSGPLSATKTAGTKMPTESRSPGWMIRRLAVMAFGAFLASAAPGRAQDMRVDRLEIVEAGFFDSAQATVTGAKPAEGAVTGMVQQLGALTLLPAPPPTSARLGI